MMASKRVFCFTPRKTPKKLRVYTPSKAQNATPSKKPSTSGYTGEDEDALYVRRQASKYISTGRISLGLEFLSKNNGRAKKAMMKLVLGWMSSDLGRLLQIDSKFTKNVSLEECTSFSWVTILAEAAKLAPDLISLLGCLLPYKDTKTKGRKGARRKLNKADQDLQQNARIGCVLSMMLYNARSSKFKFWPKVLAAQIWRQGGTQRLFGILNTLGVSGGVKAGRNTIDVLAAEVAAKATEWKGVIQMELVNNSNAMRTARRRLALTETDIPTMKHPGFSITFDNVQINLQVNKPEEGKVNFRLWANMLLMKNRVSFRSLSDDANTRIRAADVPPEDILPSFQDHMILRDRMIVVAARILVDNIPALEDIPVPRDTPHLYSREMKRKSEIINLGVLETNPGSTKGMCEILDHLIQYVPIYPDGTPFVIPLHGDGLTIDRIGRAKKAQVNNPHPLQRYEGFEEIPQEFHKEMLIMQENQDAMYSGRSGGGCGTKFQLANAFNFKKVKAKIADVSEHVFEFDKFVTIAYIVNLAMECTGMTKIDQWPQDMPPDDESKLHWVMNLATLIVSRIWQQHTAEQVRQVAAVARHPDRKVKEPFVFCKCRSEIGGDMVRCSAASCPHEWFHLSCVNLESVPDGDFWCSRSCRRSGTYVDCICKSSKNNIEGVTMVQCARAEDCFYQEFYHPACMLIPEDQVPDSWYCSQECEFAPTETDLDEVLNYSKAWTFEGLRQLAVRDMVREGDGLAQVSIWKLDMLRFWKKHPNYFPISHRFLTGLAGFFSSRVREEVTWNRSVNLKGQFMKNVPHDHCNEFVNGDFKEMLRHARGCYTDSHVKRCSLIGGTVGQSLDALLQATILDQDQPDISPAYTVESMCDPNVRVFIEEYMDEELWSYIPGRSHPGYKGFKCSQQLKLKDVYNFGRRLNSLADDMDDWRDFGVNNL